jgi:hypothetical protein
VNLRTDGSRLTASNLNIAHEMEWVTWSNAKRAAALRDQIETGSFRLSDLGPTDLGLNPQRAGGG